MLVTTTVLTCEAYRKSMPGTPGCRCSAGPVEFDHVPGELELKASMIEHGYAPGAEGEHWCKSHNGQRRTVALESTFIQIAPGVWVRSGAPDSSVVVEVFTEDGDDDEG